MVVGSSSNQFLQSSTTSRDSTSTAIDSAEYTSNKIAVSSRCSVLFSFIELLEDKKQKVSKRKAPYILFNSLVWLLLRSHFGASHYSCIQYCHWLCRLLSAYLLLVCRLILHEQRENVYIVFLQQVLALQALLTCIMFLPTHTQ